MMIIDYSGEAGTNCQCQKRAMFTVIIGGSKSDLCEKCISELGKLIIDALV
jgi:queuine/archaeosine tRNA-ribosyltransferase